MDLLVDTVRVRGAGAERLARVAASALPAALERALAGLPDGRVEAVRVTLDVDTESMDDATLAIVWADAIRAELARELGPSASSTPDAVATIRATPRARMVTLAAAARAARAWIAKGDPRAPVPADALALGALLERDAMNGVTATRDHAELVARLAALMVPTFASASLQEDLQPVPPPTAPSRPSVPTAEPDPPRAAGRAEGAAASGSSDTEPYRAAPDAGAVRRAAARVAAIAELSARASDDPPTASVDLANLTDAAGLALLYPWLADLCRTAVALHPALDAAAVRALALAAVVDPERPHLARDPLVILLAGDTERDAEPAPLPRADEVNAAAADVLASFANLLPGFAESSPEFVRREWIQRLGVIDASADPVRVTAHSHPLDVLLPQLPYPLGLFRLPWSVPVMVRFRP